MNSTTQLNNNCKPCASSNDCVCCICLEDMDTNEECKELFVCSHSFHFSCVSKWLNVKRTCPMCRQSMFNKRITRNQSFQSWLRNYLFEIIVELNSQINDYYKYNCSVDFLQRVIDSIFDDVVLFLCCWNQYYKNQLSEISFKEKITLFMKKQLLNTSSIPIQQY